MSLGRTFPIVSQSLKIPAIGLGTYHDDRPPKSERNQPDSTWQSDKGQVRNAVKIAIGAGYRHIDCAWIYGNEDEVGQGIKDSGISRSELWLTSKLWNSSHSPDRVEKALDETLKNLDVKYLDLYLMHWPVAFGKGKQPDGKKEIDWSLTNDVLPTWRAMEKLVKDGKVRNIGISNFTIGRANKLLEQAEIKPVVNQVELNLRCAQPELLAWAKKNNVILQAYSPLGSTGAPQLEDPVVQEIAKKHKVGAANVLIAWQVQRGCICLPKSVTEKRIIDNFKDLELSSEEVKKLEDRAKSEPTKRTVDPSEAWGVNIFDDSKPAKL